MFIILSKNTIAQHNWCDTYFDKASIEKINMTLRNGSGRIKSATTDTIKVGLSLYVIYASDGHGKIPKEEVQHTVNYLNEVFSQANISFFVVGDINYVESDRLSEFNLADNSDDHMEIDHFYSIKNAINIYLVPHVMEGISILLYWCGRAYSSSVGNDKILLYSPCLSGSLLAHEMGHIFSLLHTHDTSFGKELVNGSNCETAGDQICDTPADPRLYKNSVNEACEYTSAATDDNGDLYKPDISNLMSYAPNECRDHFSPQQLERMENYYKASKTNLIDHKYLSLFSTGDTVICEGQSVAFTNQSVEAVAYNWMFEGGVPGSATDENPTVIYANEGMYDVRLIITDKYGNTDTTTRYNYIKVKNHEPAIEIALSGSFEDSTLHEKIINPDFRTTFELTKAAAAKGTRSVKMNFLNYDYSQGAVDYLILGQVNNGLRNTCYLSFDYAYSSFNEEYFDGLAVVYRLQCGNWITLWEKFGTGLQTAPPSGNKLFIPNPDQWKSVTIPVSLTQDETIEFAFRTTNGWGNALYIDNYRVEPIPEKPVITRIGDNLEINSDEGNTVQWFLDNIPIENGNTTLLQITEPGTYKVTVDDGVCITESDSMIISEILSVRNLYNKKLTVYPIPASGEIHINLPEEVADSARKVRITGISGMLLYSNTITKTIDVSFLESGIYIIEVVGDGFNYKRLFVVEK